MEFRRSGDLDEALTSLAELGDKAQVLAGGTDVMIQLERGEISPETLVHIERIEGMRSIAENGRLTLGALVTHTDLAQSPVLCDRYQSVARAASLVGGWQTQAVGTIGGNVCNASPAADLLPPLLVHDATVLLVSKDRGEREVPLGDFVVGRRTIAREPDELSLGSASTTRRAVLPMSTKRLGDAEPWRSRLLASRFGSLSTKRERSTTHA